MRHAAVSIYANTLRRHHPLILIVGREPNLGADERSYGLGDYDFDRAKRCGFWNTSFGLVGGLIGLTTGELKGQCKTKRSAPLIYADASPLPLPSGLSRAQKRKQRIRIRKSLKLAHLNEIFRHEAIIRRVRVILLSGMEDFADQAAHIRNLAHQRRIPCFEISFFIGYNALAIRCQIETSRELKISLSNVIRRFARS